MTLRDRAVIVLELEGRTGEFHMIGAEPTEEFERQFLVGNRGQVIRHAVDAFTNDDGTENGEGYFLDAGQGIDTYSISYEGGSQPEAYHDIETQWGDGSSGTDQWDATGAEPDTQMQVLKWWARNASTDSFRDQARLHWGEWTDGSIDGEAGIFGEPVSVVISSVSVGRDKNKPSSFEGTVEVIRAASIAELDSGAENNPASIPDY